MPLHDPVPLLATPIKPMSDSPNANNSMPRPDSVCPNSCPTIKPTRDRQPPAKLSDYHCFLFAILSLHKPSFYREASSDPIWQKAMAD